MARKTIAFRLSNRTLRQIEWLAQRDGSTKTEAVTAAVDRMAGGLDPGADHALVITKPLAECGGGPSDPCGLG